MTSVLSSRIVKYHSNQQPVLVLNTPLPSRLMQYWGNDFHCHHCQFTMFLALWERMTGTSMCWRILSKRGMYLQHMKAEAIWHSPRYLTYQQLAKCGKPSSALLVLVSKLSGFFLFAYIIWAFCIREMGRWSGQSWHTSPCPDVPDFLQIFEIRSNTKLQTTVLEALLLSKHICMKMGNSFQFVH